MPEVIGENLIIEVQSTPNVIEVQSTPNVIELLQGGIYNFAVTNQSVNAPVYRFSWGDATPQKIFTLKKNRVLTSLILSLTEAFNGVSAIVRIGTIAFPDLFFASESLMLSQTGIIENHVCFESNTDTDIYLTIESGEGGSQGKGTIVLNITQKDNTEVL
jgi:hypothetical protein